MIKQALLPAASFAARREQFLSQMPENSVALFPAGHEQTRSNDTEYLFCQNKNFFYLTGFHEPDAVLALVKEQGEALTVLFCRDKDPLQEVWHGRRVGPEQGKSLYQFDQTYALSELDEQAMLILEGKTELQFVQGENPAFEEQVFAWFDVIRQGVKQGKCAPHIIRDCRDAIHEMRVIKSNEELDLMRKVNVISGQAHTRAMEKSHVGMFEYQIEAELLHEFARNGARFAAYNSIVAGGDNANILHYNDNDDDLKNDELLLIDAGGELAGYAADITRTFPINGKFTEPQKLIYQLVLDSQIAAIEAIKPGASFAELNDIVAEVLTKGLIELGILTGDLERLLEEKACKKYFIHGLGHWLGLDVHDVGDYHIDENRRQNRPFEPGMVMTIEPGLYFPAHDDSLDEQWRGIGVRIEDNVLVTESGFENFTVNVPKTIEEIEKVMAK